jgi:hypothetical protein
VLGKMKRSNFGKNLVDICPRMTPCHVLESHLEEGE